MALLRKSVNFLELYTTEEELALATCTEMVESQETNEATSVDQHRSSLDFLCETLLFIRVRVVLQVKLFSESSSSPESGTLLFLNRASRILGSLILNSRFSYLVVSIGADNEQSTGILLSPFL